ncbi:hypothetical protein MXB_4748 [Myxobolus squamalis]|nr:hypothetical protein MXB_4748 [Myxobolus squamalis]
MSDQYNYMHYPQYNPMYGNAPTLMPVQPNPINQNYVQNDSFQRTLAQGQGLFIPFDYPDQSYIVERSRNPENRPLDQ